MRQSVTDGALPGVAARRALLHDDRQGTTAGGDAWHGGADCGQSSGPAVILNTEMVPSSPFATYRY